MNRDEFSLKDNHILENDDTQNPKVKNDLESMDSLTFLKNFYLISVHSLCPTAIYLFFYFIFFLKIYLFIYYAYNVLSVCLLAREGTRSHYRWV